MKIILFFRESSPIDNGYLLSLTVVRKTFDTAALTA